MKEFARLNKLSKGDQVAIISPSTGLPEIFPWVQDLGLKRLQEDFGLRPKEYPTTRKMGSALKDRAKDISDAFADPENKAVFASIGGSDQIKLIKYLDPQIFIDNPKPFFGYSDNTHLHNFLWNLGIPSYYGGGIMNQFGMNVRMFELTVKTLRKALFEGGTYELEVSRTFNDIGLNWAEESTLQKERPLEENDGPYWDGIQPAEGILWGGCVESLIAQSAANKYLPPDESLNNAVLMLETSEGLPEPWIIEYLLNGFGERGWLERFSGVLVGRPKAWEFNKQNNTKQKSEYKEKQRETVVRAIREYNQTIPIVQNLDFGHTDPQIIMPLGRRATIDPVSKKITLDYS